MLVRHAIKPLGSPTWNEHAPEYLSHGKSGSLEHDMGLEGTHEKVSSHIEKVGDVRENFFDHRRHAAFPLVGR
jgi:hypothetical protein